MIILSKHHTPARMHQLTHSRRISSNCYTRRPTNIYGALRNLGKLGVVGSALLYAFNTRPSGRFLTNDAKSKVKSKDVTLKDTKTPAGDFQSRATPRASESSTQSTWQETKNLPWKGLQFLRTSLPFDEISSTVASWTWPASLAALQEKSSALLLELSRGPGSLFQQIVNDPPDPLIHPECNWDAEVRLGDELCLSERAFLRERRRKMKKAFAKLFNVDESEIDERDIPIVAIAGSGGGFRAMMNTTGSLIGAKRCGLLDCVTYVSGISGSCWALGALYSGVSGSYDPETSAEHLIRRIQTSYVDASALDLLTNPPTNKYLLSGLLRKATAPAGTASLVDIYGTLISARLLVPEDASRLDHRVLSLHHFRRAIDTGSMPLPIFTAIRHEIPASLENFMAKTKEEQVLSVDSGRQDLLKEEEKEIEKLSSWLWFEFTPYEVGCDELGAWIPSWSLGRRFNNGKSLERIPELSFSILSGIFASAFCASLQHYFNEVQPVLRQLPVQLYSWLNEIILEKSDEFGVIHPVLPDEVPNFVKGMSGLLRANSPSDISERDTIGFMDAGALLNIPYYPLLRRDVDCMIALDASADSQDLWFTRAEQYASRRGLTAWPKGARWPALLQSSDGNAPDRSALDSSAIKAENVANRDLAKAQEKEASGQAKKVGEPEGTAFTGTDESKTRGFRLRESDRQGVNTGETASVPRPIGACNIWMGSSTGSQESTPLEKLEEEDLMTRDGIAIVYNPLIPNKAVPGFDPMGVSTWLFSMEKEESEKLLKVSEANFEEGREKIVKLLRAIWLRKKSKREGKSAPE